MKMTYDHSTDALYIELTDKPVVSTKQIRSGFFLDLDEFDEVRGIEILDVRASGIEPLSFQAIHYALGYEGETMTPEERETYKQEREAAIERRKARVEQQKATEQVK